MPRDKGPSKAPLFEEEKLVPSRSDEDLARLMAEVESVIELSGIVEMERAANAAENDNESKAVVPSWGSSTASAFASLGVRQILPTIAGLSARSLTQVMMNNYFPAPSFFGQLSRHMMGEHSAALATHLTANSLGLPSAGILAWGGSGLLGYMMTAQSMFLVYSHMRKKPPSLGDGRGVEISEDAEEADYILIDLSPTPTPESTAQIEVMDDEPKKTLSR